MIRSPLAANLKAQALPNPDVDPVMRMVLFIIVKLKDSREI
jgi:hypothetical protein